MTTITELRALSREDLERRLRIAEEAVESFSDRIPQLAMQAAQDSDVPRGPVIEALEAEGFDAPDQTKEITKVTFTLNIPVEITAYLSDDNSESDLSEGWIEASLDMYRPPIRDAIESNLSLDSDFNSDREMSYDVGDPEVTSYEHETRTVDIDDDGDY